VVRLCLWVAIKRLCYIVKGAVVPVGGALVPVGGDQKVVLETGDALKVVSSDATSADVIASVLEIT